VVAREQRRLGRFDLARDAFAVAPPSRTVFLPTKSLAWIAVVPS
jgi:hypothetical protein